MDQVTIIGLDLAKRAFQVHGARGDGGVVYRQKFSRDKILTFLARQPRCVIAMEACGSAHHWGRAIRDLGHEVRLIPPIYVKPFVKRQKNDAADAEAIAEAAVRPTMRFVAVKSEDQQARAMLFRTRDLLVRQRTQTINALRGHLAEHGIVAPQGPANVKVLGQAIEDGETSLPLLVVELARIYLDQIEGLSKKIAKLQMVTVQEAKREPLTRRLQTMPGVGLVAPIELGRADHGDGDRDLCATDGVIQTRSRFRRLGRAGSPTAFDRGEAISRQDFKNGTARHPEVANYWRHGRCALGRPEGGAGRNMAQPYARAQAAHAHSNCAC